MSGSVDLTLVTGADWAIQMAWADALTEPIPFTNPVMNIRQELSPQGTLIASFDTTGTSDGTISIPTPGTLLITMSKEKTTNLPQGVGFWDLFVNYYGQSVRLLFGTISIQPHVTAA